MSYDQPVNRRWTVVQGFEIGGRRYILAQENELLSSSEVALSPRELEIVASAALGRSDKEIAHHLGIAHSTVRVLLTRARRKLGARTRAELVRRFDTVKNVNDGVQPAHD